MINVTGRLKRFCLLVLTVLACVMQPAQAKAFDIAGALMGTVQAIGTCAEPIVEAAAGSINVDKSINCLNTLTGVAAAAGGFDQLNNIVNEGNTENEEKEKEEEEKCSYIKDPIGCLAKQMTQASSQIMEYSMGLWDEKSQNEEANIKGVQNLVFYISVAIFIASFMVGGARLAASRRRGLQDGTEEIGEVIGRWLIFTICIPALIPGALEASDYIAQGILDNYGGDTTELIKAAGLDNDTLGPILIIILAIVSIVGGLMQFIALLIRMLVLPIAAGLAPAFAAASFTETGKHGLSTLVAYMISAIAFKPLSAIFYCVICWNVRNDNASVVSTVVNVLMVALAGFIIPALVKSLVPAAAASAGGSGAGLAMGAAGAAGGALVGAVTGGVGGLAGGAAKGISSLAGGKSPVGSGKSSTGSGASLSGSAGTGGGSGATGGRGSTSPGGGSGGGTGGGGSGGTGGATSGASLSGSAGTGGGSGATGGRGSTSPGGGSGGGTGGGASQSGGKNSVFGNKSAGKTAGLAAAGGALVGAASGIKNKTMSALSNAKTNPAGAVKNMAIAGVKGSGKTVAAASKAGFKAAKTAAPGAIKGTMTGMQKGMNLGSRAGTSLEQTAQYPGHVGR